MDWKVDKYCTLLGSKCKGDKCIQAAETQRIDLYHDQIQRTVLRIRRTGLFGLLKKTESALLRLPSIRFRVVKSQKSAMLQCKHFNKQIGSITEEVVDVDPPIWNVSGVSTAITFVDSDRVVEALEPDISYIDEPYDMSFMILGGLMIIFIITSFTALLSTIA